MQYTAVQTVVIGTKLPTRDVRPTVAIGGKVGVLLSLTQSGLSACAQHLCCAACR
jgi:hypothetical protein